MVSSETSIGSMRPLLVIRGSRERRYLVGEHLPRRRSRVGEEAVARAIAAERELRETDTAGAQPGRTGPKLGVVMAAIAEQAHQRVSEEQPAV